MADDSHENGTSNGDVPEIELIIKVSLARVKSTDEEGEKRQGKKGDRSVHDMGVERTGLVSSCTLLPLRLCFSFSFLAGHERLRNESSLRQRALPSSTVASLAVS